MPHLSSHEIEDLVLAYGIPSIVVRSVQEHGLSTSYSTGSQVLYVRVRFTTPWDPALNRDLGLTRPHEVSWDPRPLAVAWALRVSHLAYEVRVEVMAYGEDRAYPPDILTLGSAHGLDGLELLGRFLRRRHRGYAEVSYADAMPDPFGVQYLGEFRSGRESIDQLWNQTLRALESRPLEDLTPFQDDLKTMMGKARDTPSKSIVLAPDLVPKWTWLDQLVSAEDDL